MEASGFLVWRRPTTDLRTETDNDGASPTEIGRVRAARIALRVLVPVTGVLTAIHLAASWTQVVPNALVLPILGHEGPGLQHVAFTVVMAACLLRARPAPRS